MRPSRYDDEPADRVLRIMASLSVGRAKFWLWCAALLFTLASKCTARARRILGDRDDGR